MERAKSCGKCGKVGKTLCDGCAGKRRVSPGYHDKTYLKNRQKMIDFTWQYGLLCWVCGYPFMAKKDITADHKIPRREGGTHDLDNLAPAHERCNKGWRRKREKKVSIKPTVNNDYLEW